MSPRNAMPIVWTESAAHDLEGIADYLLGEGAPFADVEEYVQRIYAAPKYLATLPGAGKPGRMPGTREWLVKDAPYALVYAVRENSVRTLRVLHGARQLSGG